MRILGIHDGHTATACLVEDGEIKVAVSEERFTKEKGYGGFPRNAIEYILREKKIKSDHIDIIALAGIIKPIVSIDLYKKGRQKYFPYFSKLYPGDIRKVINTYINIASKYRLKNKTLRAELNRFHFPLEKIKVVEHHKTHAYSAYYLSNFYEKKEEALVFTLDGSGDGLSGTVSIFDGNGKLKRVKEISTFDSLGMIYSRVTQYLGMKPWEHEYKLMGIAPYVSRKYSEKAYELMTRYIGLDKDGLGFLNISGLWGNGLLKKMWNDFRGMRFDSIAAGIQLLHERLITKLISNWIDKTKIRKVALAGGCFMNVKANKLITELNECDEVFVMPSCGDESCAIGAAVFCNIIFSENAGNQMGRMNHLYFGPRYSEEVIKNTIQKYTNSINFQKIDDVEKRTAELLAGDKIVGRFSGNMEWGARALGNRSILAKPSNLGIINKINSAIKLRDFWMPFAPSIIWEKIEDYAVINKKHQSFFMTLAYDSTPLARKEMIASLHPYDFTMRPQFVKEEHNKKYYHLIKEFEKLTGIGGVLNTSFNLHGYPIVCDPEDAINTLIKSSLDYITIEDYLIWKK